MENVFDSVFMFLKKFPLNGLFSTKVTMLPSMFQKCWHFNN